jgi:hypothetical protein
MWDTQTVTRRKLLSQTRGQPDNGSEIRTALQVVRRQVGSLHYGMVQIVMHDSQVTQIEKTERVRLGKTRAQTIQDDLK